MSRDVRSFRDTSRSTRNPFGYFYLLRALGDAKDNAISLRGCAMKNGRGARNAQELMYKMVNFAIDAVSPRGVFADASAEIPPRIPLLRYLSLSRSVYVYVSFFYSFFLPLPPSLPRIPTAVPKRWLGSVNESSLHSSYDLFFAHGQRTQAGTISPLLPPLRTSAHTHVYRAVHTHTHIHAYTRSKAQSFPLFLPLALAPRLRSLPPSFLRL